MVSSLYCSPYPGLQFLPVTFWPKTYFVNESFSGLLSREQQEVAAGGRVIPTQSVLHVLIHIKPDSLIVWDCKLGNTTVIKTNEKLNKQCFFFGFST